LRKSSRFCPGSAFSNEGDVTIVEPGMAEAGMKFGKAGFPVRRLLILAGVSVPVIAGVVVLIIILAKRKRELICMRISDILGMTFKNLMRRKIRTLLTLTGVLIGRRPLL